MDRQKEGKTGSTQEMHEEGSSKAGVDFKKVFSRGSGKKDVEEAIDKHSRSDNPVDVADQNHADKDHAHHSKGHHAEGCNCKELEAQLQKKEQEIADITDMLKRTQAEFINFKNRTEKDSKALLEYGSAGMLRNILPVVDSFEQALKNGNDPEFKKGMELIYSQLQDILRAEGLVKINALGKKFDPYKHEVMMKEKSDKEEGTVLEEFQAGYELKGRIIRHSKVKIAG
jgi:molecular chaperone GrpE